MLEYLIPLVDANLVRDIAWHDCLGGLAGKCLDQSVKGPPPTGGWVMFPVLWMFLRAAQQKLPIYLWGGFGGATGAIADALTMKSSERPPEFTTSQYANAQTPNYGTLLEGLDKMNAKKFSGPEQAFGELWEIIQIGRQNGLAALFLNGLDDEDNRKLITTTDTLEAVHLAWKGLSRLFLEPTAP